jgi:hypothetical protein
VTVLAQPRGEVLLELEAGVVGTEVDAHALKPTAPRAGTHAHLQVAERALARAQAVRECPLDDF